MLVVKMIDESSAKFVAFSTTVPSSDEAIVVDIRTVEEVGTASDGLDVEPLIVETAGVMTVVVVASSVVVGMRVAANPSFVVGVVVAVAVVVTIVVVAGLAAVVVAVVVVAVVAVVAVVVVPVVEAGLAVVVVGMVIEALVLETIMPYETLTDLMDEVDGFCVVAAVAAILRAAAVNALDVVGAVVVELEVIAKLAVEVEVLAAAVIVFVE